MLWESPSKVVLQQQKPTKVVSKKPTPKKPQQLPQAILTDTFVLGGGSFRCNFCDK